MTLADRSLSYLRFSYMWHDDIVFKDRVQLKILLTEHYHVKPLSTSSISRCRSSKGYVITELIHLQVVFHRFFKNMML